jgi:hypothetical protein
MNYHWGWYLLGLTICPRITFMIFLSYHTSIPLWFKFIGWVFAILIDIKWEVK